MGIRDHIFSKSLPMEYVILFQKQIEKLKPSFLAQLANPGNVQKWLDTASSIQHWKGVG